MYATYIAHTHTHILPSNCCEMRATKVMNKLPFRNEICFLDFPSAFVIFCCRFALLRRSVPHTAGTLHVSVCKFEAPRFPNCYFCATAKGRASNLCATIIYLYFACSCAFRFLLLALRKCVLLSRSLCLTFLCPNFVGKLSLCPCGY